MAGKAGSDKRWAFLEGLDIGADGDPYLDRLRIVHTPWLGLYLHHIHRPDKDLDPHDHPWAWFLRLVLAGDYTEFFWPDKRKPQRFATRERRRWSFGIMRRRSAHIITGIRGPLWTLVIAGPRRGEWGFWRQGQFVPWRDYTEKGNHMAEQGAAGTQGYDPDWVYAENEYAPQGDGATPEKAAGGR